MSNLHQEHHFETTICEALAAQGWLYQQGDAAHYDAQNALFLPDLLAWVQETQPKAWDKLQSNHGAQAATVLAERLRKQLNERGTLDVLRQGIELLGLSEPLRLLQFKPALNINPTIAKDYAANRLRVVRQVHHSLNNPKQSIDMVLFINGLPTATIELKSDFTQDLQAAIDQYRFDRDPHPKGGVREPLLSFVGGALVHFAVSHKEAVMTTHLAGAATRFLPFNQGNNGGAGNPSPVSGIPTAYLWQEVWTPDSWLHIVGRYLIGRLNDKKQLSSVIFPRYHQLDATRQIVADVLENGAGQRYLIQHSAGSGKTNSIAWTAHFLADLHDAQNQKIFDSVLVVSDRTVLDSQLQEAIFSFERTTGVVASISGNSGSKTKELADALQSGKKIIVCTIQTFPFALSTVQELAATEGKRFAVIADEAHSSQTSESAAKLKQLLSVEEWNELQDGGEMSTEDILTAQMTARAASGNGLTYVAFTATPKSKTLELFGRKDQEGQPRPFHVYSMRQAIEEGFILDVLKNYTSYNMAFQLAQMNEAENSAVGRKEATKQVMQWVRLHPYNIAQKVQVVVEHFRENVQPLLDGKAKAMVVVSSRKEAVRWQKAITQYIADKGYGLGCLVAFSGEIDDPESFPEAVSETSTQLNPNLKSADIREAFNQPTYHLLLVANKFQTGFDQPLLCGMYVDKMLGGIQAVQTLSRLNRAYPNKDTTYVLDFVNEPNAILAAFKTYYETAELESCTNPNLVYDLRAKLDATAYYDEAEVDRVAAIRVNPKSKQTELVAAIFPVAERLLKAYKHAQTAHAEALVHKDEAAAQAAKDALAALLLFKTDMASFARLYIFLSQIFDYGNTAIEKRYVFYKCLLPLLEFGRDREQIDLSKVVMTHHVLKNQGQKTLSLQEGEAQALTTAQAVGSGAVQDKQKAYLSDVIQRLNDLFEGDLTEQDRLIYVNGVILGKMLENQTLIAQAMSNTKEQFDSSPDFNQALVNTIIDALDAHTSMSTQALNSPHVLAGIKEILLGSGQLYEKLRERAEK